MKKVFLILAFLLASAVSFAKIDRDTLPTPYPQYTFWSNWNVGVNGGLTFNNIGDSSFHGCGFDVYVERPISYVFDIRFTSGVRFKDNFSSACVPFTAGMTLDWIDLFERTKRTHRFELYSLAGLGFCYNASGDYFTNGNFAYDGYAGLGLGLVLGANYNWKIRIESKVDAMTDVTRWGASTMYQHTTLGVQYNFGISNVDKQRFEMLAMIKAEDEAILRSMQESARDSWLRADTLAHEVENLEHMLLHHVCCGDGYELELIKKDSIIYVYDSILNDMRDNQLNTYALPFSVMFDVNSYTINESEYIKLNQIAKFMKEDGGKYKVVGFASSDGSDSYNLKLSQKRVDAIYKYLVRKGVKEDNLEKDAKGESVLFGDSTTKLNRRVSFYRVF